MSTDNVVQKAAGWLGGYFDWLQETLASETARRAVLADLGLDPVETPPLDIDGDRVSSIDAYSENTDVDEQAFLAVWQDILVVVESIEAFLDAAGDGEDAIVKESLRQFLSLTSTEYVRLRWPTLFFVAKLLGVVEDRLPAGFYAAAEEVITTDVFKNLFALLEAPFDHFARVYSTPEDDAGARALGNSTLIPGALLLAYWDQTARQGLKILGADVEVPTHKVLQGWDTHVGTTSPVGDHLSESMLSFSFSGLDLGSTVKGAIGVTLAWVPRDAGGPGLFLSLNGSVDLKLDFGSVWKLNTRRAFPGIVDFLIWSDWPDVNAEDAPTAPTDPANPTVHRRHGPPAGGASPGDGLLAGEQVRFTLAPVHATPQDPLFLSILGTRLELGSATLSAVVADHGVEIKMLAQNCALVVAKSDGDGFVQRLVPDSGIRMPFELGIGIAFTPKPRLFLEGGSGLQTTIPLNRSAGPIRLQQLFLELAGGSRAPEGGARFEASVGAALGLGPFTLSVDRLGFEVAVANSSATPSIGFKPPSGVGLLIDAEIVTGGGYLFHDPSTGQYAGVVQLDFKGITLQAIGLIETKLPDGSPGFSMLLLIEAADFPPIDLAFGFRLTGVGGVVGYQRTVALEPLRAGLKGGVLDSILFPTNVVRDAPRIVSALNTLLPIKGGQHLVAPVARLVWGFPAILTLELAVIVEGDSPWRVVVLGQLRAELPQARGALVKLRMDAIGVFDKTRGEVTIDAVLFDSAITRFPIAGDMAMRLRWKGDPTFALAVGGLHPKFDPPAGFPKLNRVTVGLSQSSNTKLTLSAYLAVTSNTAQIGARLDFLFRRSGFSVEGTLGFDALFSFHPFSFVVDFQAGVTLKWHGRTLLGVKLELTLAGTTPWRARGKATFEIWRFSKSVSFDHTFGDDPPPPELPTADPTPILLTALRDRRSWSANVIGAPSALVTLRESLPTDDVLLHPLGELSVRQRVVPLGIEISRFGSSTVVGARRFDVVALAPDGNQAFGAGIVLDHFAPAQFLDLSDAEKLARPSFEKMGAGVRVAVGGVTWGGQDDPALIGDADMRYETRIVGVPEELEPSQGAFVPTSDDLRLTAMFGAVARGPMRRTVAARYGRADDHAAPVLAEPSYAIVSTADLSDAAMPGMEAVPTSFTAAAQALGRQVSEHPELAGRWQVVEAGTSR
jgi:hypothetical protein